MKEIKKYIVGFIVGILSVGSISYAADSGSIGALFEKVGNNWRLLGDNIKDDTVDSSEIENNSLKSEDIENNSLTSDDLASNSVGNSEMIDNSIGSIEVINNSLTSDDLASNSVGTDEVALDSLTALDLAPNSVGSSELVDNPTFTNPKASTPTASNHVATKGYVDSKVSSIGGGTNKNLYNCPSVCDTGGVSIYSSCHGGTGRQSRSYNCTLLGQIKLY